MPREIFFEIPNDKYGQGILLNEYNETFSLVSARKPKEGDGTVYMEWCYPQRDRKPLEKNGELVTVPFKVSLGNQRQAIEVLKYFLKQLTNNDEPPF